mmetsp:Transcript_6091/g.14484  ORF Transcript_6091/g.14484 Transcript_6091/m.14484 type:complete len:333 (+) Transcript_6091:479-1477(+)
MEGRERGGARRAAWGAGAVRAGGVARRRRRLGGGRAGVAVHMPHEQPPTRREGRVGHGAVEGVCRGDGDGSGGALHARPRALGALPAHPRFTDVEPRVQGGAPAAADPQGLPAQRAAAGDSGAARVLPARAYGRGGRGGADRGGGVDCRAAAQPLRVDRECHQQAFPRAVARRRRAVLRARRRMCLEGGRRHDAGDYPDAQGLGEARGGGARWEWGAAQSEDPRYFQGGPGDFLQPLVERPQHRGGARDPRRHREPHAGACLVRRPDDDAQGPVPVADDRGGEERVGGVHLPLTRGARERELPPRDLRGPGAAADGQHPRRRPRHGAGGDVR